MNITENQVRNLYRALLVLFVILSAFFLLKTFHEFRYYDTAALKDANTMSFTGHGEIEAVPDIATIYFSVESSKATQDAASSEVDTKVKSVLDFLKESGVEEKDIKTEGYNSYPKYSTPNPCPVYSGRLYPCPEGSAKITGYTVSQSINVKIRKIDDTSKIVNGVNNFGVTSMSGPNFAIDKEDELKAQARKQAIEDAKAKAKALAKDLGVHLGQIANFNESGNFYPMYDAYKVEAQTASVAPQLPTGQNKITSDVTITYVIR